MTDRTEVVIDVGSPLSGWVWPLAATPDAAFASGALGPGVALDPVAGELLAPFDGEVVTLHAAHHAVVLRHAAGPEVLIHVGVDTVELAGRGFEAVVSPGDTVARGQVLIRFDLDTVARAAPSLVSPVVLVDAAGFKLEQAISDAAIQAGATLFRLRGRPVTSAAPAAPAQTIAERRLAVALPHGLHARPAAALARIVRAHGAEGVLTRDDGQTASLLSPSAIMALGLGRHAEVTVRIMGEERHAAMEAVAAFLDDTAAGSEIRTDSVASPPVVANAAGPGVILGLCAAPGVGTGPIHRWTPHSAHAADRNVGAPDWEAGRLVMALQRAAKDLTADAAWAPAGSPLAGVLAAHLGLAEDPALRDDALSRIAAGTPAGAAWRDATEAVATRLARLADTRLAARAADLRDVSERVLHALADGDEAAAFGALPPAGAILTARDLPPSALSRLSTAGLAGVCLAESGPTAHVALIAAALGLPMVVSAGSAVMRLTDGAVMTLDAGAGRLSPVDPRAVDTPATATAIPLECSAVGPAATADGIRITVLANLGAADEAETAVRLGAEGCGLLRTEFLFMQALGPPSETAQREAYARVIAGLGGRPLVIRTLDAGADKPLPWLPFPREANPALGRRGIRVGLARPDLLATQLRAIAALPPEADVSVMAPMITSVRELRQVRAALEQACRENGRASAPPLGIMIETPAAVFDAERLAAEADFFSIGTNDLAQYVLAADRAGGGGPGEVAADAFDPAVLRAIAQTVRGAASHGTPLTVCGGLASDPLGAAVLLGLGVRRLSCAPAAIADVKRQLARLRIPDCETLAARALEAGSAAEVRALARDATAPPPERS